MPRTKVLTRYLSSNQLIQQAKADELFHAIITVFPAIEYLHQNFLSNDNVSTPDEFDQLWYRFNSMLARFDHFPRIWLSYRGDVPTANLPALPNGFKPPFAIPPKTLPPVEDMRDCEYWDKKHKHGLLHSPIAPKVGKKEKAKSAAASSSTAAPAPSPSKPLPKSKPKATAATAAPTKTPSPSKPMAAASAATPTAKPASAVPKPSTSDGSQRVLHARVPASERATEIAKQQVKVKPSVSEKRPGPDEASSSKSPPKSALKQTKPHEPPAPSSSPTPRPKKRKRVEEEDEGEFMPGNSSDIERTRVPKAKTHATIVPDYDSRIASPATPNSAPVTGNTNFQSVINSLTDAIKEHLTLFKGRNKSKKFSLTELKSFNFAAPKNHGVFFGKEIDLFKPQYLPMLKIPSVVVTEADFSSAGIPPSACLACVLFRTECTRVAFGMSCVQCQARDLKHCDHGQSIEELIRFYMEIASNYSLASDATEMILMEFLSSSERAQDAARLYRKASLDLASRFKFFVAHAFRCIDLMGEEKFRDRFTREEYTADVPDIVDYINHLIAQFNEQCIPAIRRPDTIPADYEIPDPDRFFRPNHDTVLREFKRFLGPDNTNPNDVVASIRHNLVGVFDSAKLLPSQSELGITAAQLAKLKRKRAGSLPPESEEEEEEGEPENEDSGEEEDDDVKEEVDDDAKSEEVAATDEEEEELPPTPLPKKKKPTRAADDDDEEMVDVESKPSRSSGFQEWFKLNLSPEFSAMSSNVSFRHRLEEFASYMLEDMKPTKVCNFINSWEEFRRSQDFNPEAGKFGRDLVPLDRLFVHIYPAFAINNSVFHKRLLLLKEKLDLMSNLPDIVELHNKWVDDDFDTAALYFDLIQ
ncbi:hypothetical protein C8R46DRAFT_1206687 [Mycena filopes]|nr:hypothetical protein C8R46DRAFT_1206687 [Mycena filopes]